MNLAPYIDHTLLKADSTLTDIRRLCDEAKEHRFKAVCVPPYFVWEACKELCKSTHVKVATVIGFPFGYSAVDAKVAELETAMRQGAHELDMVINLAALKSGDWDYLEAEIKACVETVKSAGRAIKVIVESGILTGEELDRCCDLYGQYEIDFMKTSTGYAARGATVEAVQTMRRLLPEQIAIKASGGIRTYSFALELIAAGATRLGTSAGVQLMAESQ